MEIKTKIYEVSEEYTRKEEDKERIIFQLREYKNVDGDEVQKSEWVYHAPNAQDHTEKQVAVILGKLKVLNTRFNEEVIHENSRNFKEKPIKKGRS